MRGLRFRGCFGLKVKETVEILSLTLIFPLLNELEKFKDLPLYPLVSLENMDPFSV